IPRRHPTLPGERVRRLSYLQTCAFSDVTQTQSKGLSLTLPALASYLLSAISRIRRSELLKVLSLQQHLCAFARPFHHHCLPPFPHQLPRLLYHSIDHIIVMTGIVVEKQNPFRIRIERELDRAAE